MENAFPLRRTGWSRLLWPLVRGEQFARVEDGVVRVRLGALGGAEIPVAAVDRLGRLPWPWWGGFGARIGRRLVAFTMATGPLALIELAEPVAVRTPFRWRTPRVAVGVADVDGFLRAVAHERARIVGAADTDADERPR